MRRYPLSNLIVNPSLSCIHCFDPDNTLILLKIMYLEPFTPNPSVEEVQGCLGLIHGYHVAGSEDLEEGEVTTVLDLAVLLATAKFDVFNISLVEGFLPRPFECLSPGLVSKPVADVISITSVDQNWDLRKDARNEPVEWLHPITLEKEVSVDIEVATIIAANFSAKLGLDFLQVQVLGNVAEGRIAEVARVLTLATDIINVLSGFLVWPDERIVAINTCRHARPNTLAIIAVLD